MKTGGIAYLSSPRYVHFIYIYIKRDTRYRPIFRVQNGTIHHSVLRDERERERGLRPKGHDLPFSINLRYANLIGRQPLCTTQGTAPLSDRPSAPSIRPSFRYIRHPRNERIRSSNRDDHSFTRGEKFCRAERKGDILYSVGSDDFVEIAG